MTVPRITPTKEAAAYCCEVPAGWKLVPIEPTPEMVEASCRALIYYGRLPGDTPRERHHFKHAMRLRAAIAAAPEPGN